MAGAGAGAKKRDTGGARAEEKKFRLHNTRKKINVKKSKIYTVNLRGYSEICI